MTTISGNQNLAKALGISCVTLYAWKKDGIFDDAIIFQYRRTIMYDFEKVIECLKHRSVKRGRRKEQ